MAGSSQRKSRRWNDSIIATPFGKLSINFLITVAFVLVGTCSSAYGYSSGAPAGVCDTMTPAHGVAPQTSPSPYKVTISKQTLKGLETLDITLKSKTGNDQFKGFLIQVRKVGSDKPTGNFSSLNNVEAQTLDCNELNNAMTHTSGDLKKTVTVQWVAPNTEDAEYQVFYTVVGLEAQKFWSGIQHEEIIVVTKDLSVSTAAPIYASNELREKWKNIYEGCGESKGCFGVPENCVMKYIDSVNPTTCEMLVTWTKLDGKGNSNVFELTGRPGGQSGHIALGLSSDARMGLDSVVACIVNNGNLEPISRFHNTGWEPPVKHLNSSYGLTSLGNEFIDGNIFCKFSQTNHQIGDVDINFENNFYLLLAKASSLRNNSLAYHNKVHDREVSSTTFHITDTTVVHGSLVTLEDDSA